MANSLRTFEIFTKYISKNSGVKIRLEPGACPCADIKNNEIVLPLNVKEENIFAALAEATHEACHVRYSKNTIEGIAEEDELEHTILNAIEDIRIDHKAFGILPNISAFYEESFQEILKKRPATIEERKKLPFEVRVLCDEIAKREGFHFAVTGDADVQEFINAYGIDERMYRAQEYIENGQKDKAQKEITEIAKAFDQDRKKKNNNKETPRPQKGDLDSGMKELGKDAGKLWSDLGESEGSGLSTIGTAALEEATQKAFEELLKIKEEKEVSCEEGRLNADSLTSFHTGDIDELFKDEVIIRPKKSKILIVLDSSGSMQTDLLDGNSCIKVVADTAKAVCDILDEVNAKEGLCIEYEVARFDTAFHMMDQSNWQSEYTKCQKGGTSVKTAFEEAQKRILSDIEVEGSKIILFITDGEVCEGEIDEVKKAVLAINEDVRVMLIGVGANSTGWFCKQIIGSNNILELDSANCVLMDVIMDALE